MPGDPDGWFAVGRVVPVPGVWGPSASSQAEGCWAPRPLPVTVGQSMGRACSRDLEGSPCPQGRLSAPGGGGASSDFLSFCFRLQLLEFDKELSVFKDRLYELDISFPPR